VAGEGRNLTVTDFIYLPLTSITLVPDRRRYGLEMFTFIRKARRWASYTPLLHVARAHPIVAPLKFRLVDKVENANEVSGKGRNDPRHPQNSALKT
jgi:hypothetical protein